MGPKLGAKGGTKGTVGGPVVRGLGRGRGQGRGELRLEDLDRPPGLRRAVKPYQSEELPAGVVGPEMLQVPRPGFGLPQGDGLAVPEEIFSVLSHRDGL